MKKLLFAFLFALTFMSTIESFAQCDNPWDTASDGSRCGGRASSQRPGGRR
jgi:hypothetical protein